METLLEFFIRVPLGVLFTKIRIGQEMVSIIEVTNCIDLGSRLNRPLITGQGLEPTSVRLSFFRRLIGRTGNAISGYGIASLNSLYRCVYFNAEIISRIVHFNKNNNHKQKKQRVYWRWEISGCLVATVRSLNQLTYPYLQGDKPTLPLRRIQFSKAFYNLLCLLHLRRLLS